MVDIRSRADGAGPDAYDWSDASEDLSALEGAPTTRARSLRGDERRAARGDRSLPAPRLGSSSRECDHSTRYPSVADLGFPTTGPGEFSDVARFDTSDTKGVESRSQRGESRDVASYVPSGLCGRPASLPRRRAGTLLQPKRGIGSEGRLSWISRRSPTNGSTDERQSAED